jgi:hypothetical protein
MTLELFIFLSAINIGLLIFLVRNRGWTSCEGLCAVYLLAIILSDNVEIVFLACFWPERLLLGSNEINLRIYPTIVHIVGIGILLAGLTLVNPNPRPVSRVPNRDDKRTLIHIGVALVLIGATLHGIAIYRGAPTGFTTDDVAYAAVERQGAFLYRGGNIALLGLALLFACLRGISRKIVGVAVLLTPIVVYFNKGGLERGILFAALTCSVYQSSQFKKLLRSRVTWAIGIPVTLLAVVLVIGAKNHHRKGNEIAETSSAFLAGLDSVGARYSADGLYRGYSQMLMYMRDGWVPRFDGRILFYSMTDWLPGVIFRDKPEHPTRNTGYMIYSDHHSYSTDASAYTLVGMAYADFGLPSVIGYLLMLGAALGLIRRVANRVGGNLYVHVGYLFMSLFGACSHESGFIDFVYTALLATAVMGIARLVVYVFFRENDIECCFSAPMVARYQDSSKRFSSIPGAPMSKVKGPNTQGRKLVQLRRAILRARTSEF